MHGLIMSINYAETVQSAPYFLEEKDVPLQHLPLPCLPDGIHPGGGQAWLLRSVPRAPSMPWWPCPPWMPVPSAPTSAGRETAEGWCCNGFGRWQWLNLQPGRLFLRGSPWLFLLSQRAGVGWPRPLNACLTGRVANPSSLPLRGSWSYALDPTGPWTTIRASHPLPPTPSLSLGLC